ncbi:MAG: hypothetical protein HY243_09755 [Proteobacteria bacterium]|nr:hypothetical protein [Pseudomonadota bacterium]
MYQATVDRRQLKSKLLAGAAGLAAVAATSAAYADESTPAPAADPQKWSWAVDAGGGVGSGFTAGKIDLLAPVWQDMDSLLFVRLGAGTSNEVNSSYNLGLGYRAKIDPEWILGLYAGWDGSTTEFNHHSFNQVALGAELMSTDWDVRLNGYISADNSLKTISNKFSLFIHDTRIAILQGQEAAYSGIDGEVGYRVFHTDDTDVRAFVGGFWFEHSQDAVNVSMGRTFDFSFHDLAGPKGRVEVNVFDLDELGAQSRLSFEGEIANDSERGTTGFVGATVRIPLDVVSGGGAQALDDLDRRMVDPVRRSDNVLTQWEFTKPEPVVIYGPHMTSRKTNTVLYVDNSAGLGSYPDPTTLHDATTRTTVGTEHYINSFIVITSKEGDILVDTAAKEGVMQSGQSLVGGNEHFNVRGVYSGQVFGHTFAPGTSDPSINVLNYETPVNLIGTDHDNVYGFTIEGTFEDAIYGHNVDHLNISKMRIDGKEDGQAAYGDYGVYIRTDISRNMNLYMWGDNISHVQYDGVELVSDIEDYGSSTQHITMINVNVTDAGEDGIDFDAYTYYSTLRQTISITGSHVFDVGNNGIDDSIDTYGGYIRQTIGIHNSTVYYAGNYGMYFKAYAGAGGTAIQNITIDPTFVRYNNYGIGIFAYGNDGDVFQFATLSDVDAGDNYYDNIRIGARASDGFVEQSVAMYNVKADYSYYGRGVVVNAFANFGGEVLQFVYANGLDADGNYYDNIRIAGSTATYGFVYQGVDLRNVDASYSDYGNGVYMKGYAPSSGTTIQRLTLISIDANYNYDDGLRVHGYAKSYFAPAVVAQYVFVDEGDFNDNYGDGVRITTEGRGPFAATLSDDTIEFSDMSSNSYDGADFVAEGVSFGSAQQNVRLYGDDFYFNDGNGAVIAAIGVDVGFAAQYAKVVGSTFDENDSNGLVLDAIGVFGGIAQQNALMYFDDFNFNGSNGVEEFALSKYLSGPYYPSVTQNVIAYFFDAVENGTNGWYIDDISVIGGNIHQLTYLYGAALDFNGASGLRAREVAAIYSNIYSNLYFINSDAIDNSAYGIQMKTYAIGKTFLIDHTTVAGSTLDGNGDSGFYNLASATGKFSLNVQYVGLFNSEFDFNGYDGATFVAYQNYGPGSFGAAIQDVTIAGSDFSYNGRDGLHLYAEATNTQGRAEQHFNIFYSRFNYNYNDGIYIGAYAHDGTYIATHACQYVQGLSGGCAFVRQTVNIVGSDVSYNNDDGIQVVEYANDYGAIYTYSGRPGGVPTLFLYNTDVTHNGDVGLEMYNYIGDGSYLYQYVVAVSSHFDKNGDYGIYAYSYMVVGSANLPAQLIQQITLAGSYNYGASTVNHNGSGGIYIGVTAYDTYAIPGVVFTGLSLYDTDVSYNDGDGVEMIMNATGVYLPIQIFQSAYSRVSYNDGDGVEMIQNGTRNFQDIQVFAARDTYFNGNGEDGARLYQGTFKTFTTAYQLFYSYANTFNDNYFAGAYIESKSYRDGVYTGFGAVQKVVTLYSEFDDNFNGSGLSAHVSSIEDFTSLQTVFSRSNDFSGNYDNGLSVTMTDKYTFSAAQKLVSLYDFAFYNGESGVNQSAGFSGEFVASQLSEVVGGFMSGNGDDGIRISSSFYDVDYGYATQFVENNLVKYSGNDGISISTGSYGDSSVYNFTYVANNAVEHSYNTGIYVHMAAEDPGSYLGNDSYYGSVGVVIKNNYVSYSGYNGIEVRLTSYGLSEISGTPGTFNTGINGNFVTDSGNDGILVAANNFDAFLFMGTVIGLGGTNFVYDSGGYGIQVATSNVFGLLYSGAVISDNHVAYSGAGGISVNNYEFDGFTDSDVIIIENYVTGLSTFAGINIVDTGHFGTLDSDAYIIDNSVTFGTVGIGVYAYGDTGVYQYDLISGNIIAGNFTGIVGIDGTSAADNSYQTINTLGNNFYFFNFTNTYFDDDTFSGHQTVF